MALDIRCPVCDEDEDLAGESVADGVQLHCEACGQTWFRSTSPRCPVCGGIDLQEVPHALVEKGRGTQLSVVGIRVIPLCWECDRSDIDRWQMNRPNPLMPAEIPTFTADE